MPTASGILHRIRDLFEEELRPLILQVHAHPEALSLVEMEDKTMQGLVVVGRELLGLLAGCLGPTPLAVPSRKDPEAVLPRRGLKERTILTTFGEIKFSRPYYHDKELQESRWPRDEQLGLRPREKFSPRLQEVVAYLSTVTHSYDQAAQVLSRLRGVEIAYKQAQREVLRIGEEIEKEADARIQEAFPKKANPKLPWEGVATMVIGCDGITTPHCAGSDMEIKVGRVDVVALQAPPSSSGRQHKRQKRRRAGRETARDEKRQEQLSDLKDSREQREYQAASRLVEDVLKEAFPERRDKPRMAKTSERSTYRATARLGVETIGRLLWLAAKDRGLGVNTKVIFLSDGGGWCRTVAETNFPGACLILDIFHLARHVIALANALHTPESQTNREWRYKVLLALATGNAGAVLDTLESVEFSSQRQQEEAQKFVAYVKANRDRMNYPEYAKAGYPLGSGIIEGACRHVIGDRMKGSGRHWDDDGGDAMARLRAIECSQEWDETFKRRFQARQSGGPALALAA